MSDCEHREIHTWFFNDGAPAGMWSCMDCRHKFVPITELMRAEDELTAARTWKDAVIEKLAVTWAITSENENYPQKAVNDLVASEVAIALNPAVSSEAEALIERGRQDWRAEVEALRAAVKSLVDGTNAYGDGGRWSVNMQTVLKARAALKEKS